MRNILARKHPDSGSNDSSYSSTFAFQEVARIATELTGVQLTERHFAMILSRLQKRLDGIGLRNIDEYLEHLKANWDQETPFLISALTTHHTYFFRESSQFEFLTERALKEIIVKVRARHDKTIRIWSAACSRGHEVYSLAMVLSFALRALAPDLKLDILGTDIDPQSLKIAENAVYPWNEVKKIPQQYLSKNWARGSGDIAEYAKIKKHVRSLCRFETKNLLHFSFDSSTAFDAIFCRNVFIYFTPEQIQSITLKMLQYLQPGGFLFLGISESLQRLQLPVRSIAPSVYVAATTEPSATLPPPPPPVEKKQKLRIMVVDDSPSIHSLMKRIFLADEGFEIVAHAKDGVEAAQLLETTSVDAMTLDIHMPVQNGVEYLKTRFNAQHPPVIMVSSVSREDANLGMQAMKAGAADYLEKPTLENFQEKAEELRTKVRYAIKARSKVKAAPKRLAQPGPYHPDSLILIGSSTGGTEALKEIFTTFPAEIPPVLVVQHIPPGFSKAFAERMNELCAFEVKEAADDDLVLPNRILIAPGGLQMEVVKKGTELRVKITDGPPMNRHKPSVDYLFESVSKIAANKKIIAAILTGMGADGARGLKLLCDLGAKTLVQNEETSVIYGMPKEALLLGGAKVSLPLNEIPEKLLAMAQETLPDAERNI